MILPLVALMALIGAAPLSPGDLMATATASITLRLHAAPERAFPMFDPVNESRWSPDWNPVLLGHARIESGLVFTTDDGDGRTVWLLDRYDPATREIRYVSFRSSTLTTIDIAVKQDAVDESTATVTYTRTALDSEAVQSVRSFTHQFPAQGPHWENAINAALTTK